MSFIRSLARPEILAMEPYQSARGTVAADGILLNANEAPESLIAGTGRWCLELNRYPPPQPQPLLERMSALYGVGNDQLLVTRGSDEGIDLLMRVFCRPGMDAIVECPPCFGMYAVAANIQGAKVNAVPRDPQRNLQIDIEALCLAITARKNIRLVFLTTPNNPTGDVITQTGLETILGACENNALLVLDEAYIEFSNSKSAARLLARYPNLVVLRTLSKAWGAAGLRCGAVLANPEVIMLLKKVMAPYPLSTPAIEAALLVTSSEAQSAQCSMLEKIALAKASFLDQLKNFNWIEKIWPGEANFILMRVDDAPALVSFCSARGIRIRDFSKQNLLHNCVRLTIGTEDEMTTLGAVFAKYRTDERIQHD